MPVLFFLYFFIFSSKKVLTVMLMFDIISMSKDTEKESEVESLMKCEKIDWFEMFVQDKQNILNTMQRNMAADLEAGYDFYGMSIQRQIQEMDEYKAKFDADLDKIAEMDENKVQRWCYIQLLKAGAI